MKVLFSNPVDVSSGSIIIMVFEGRAFGKRAAALDKRMDNSISRAMKASQFLGKAKQRLCILAPSDKKIDRIIVIGVGKEIDIDSKLAENIGGELLEVLEREGAKSASVYVDSISKSPIKPEQFAAHFAFGLSLRSYKFDKYKTVSVSKTKPKPQTISLQVAQSGKARSIYKELEKIKEGVFLTRDLVSEPPNILFPISLAERCKQLTKLGVKVEILTKSQMEKKGMGALLGVAQGSAREPRMVIMHWKGIPSRKKGKTESPLAFVGKGVTFDTGGISLKPSAGMEDMKWDMGGAGVVIGLMSALAGRKAKANVVGVVGLVENMPGGNAQRPGDIVTSMSGQTIEVLNTDAEGRLVLADAIHYTNERFSPKFVINLATLTGAIIISLGNEFAGLFSNNDRLSERLVECGYEVDEKVWRMPLDSAFDKMLNCDAADMKNISAGRGAGSITAAQFIQRFVGKVPWVHLDIAGVTWSSKAKPTVPKGGTAFGVRLLERLVAKYYEAK